MSIRCALGFHCWEERVGKRYHFGRSVPVTRYFRLCQRCGKERGL